jgi:hypothetical protein
MTEADWLNCDDAVALLEHIYPQRGLDSVEPQSRSSRLYLLACARRAWDHLPGVCRALVSVAERIFLARPTDKSSFGQVYPLAEELTHLRGEAKDLNGIGWKLASMGLAEPDGFLLRDDLDPQRWSGIAQLVYLPFSRTTPAYRRVPEEYHSAALVREIFADPFVDLPRFDRAWRSETVVQLARHAESTADFSTLPILADALEEAGCDCDDVLDHLRRGGPHARGCWALELVLR